jgi:hypothetical protein
MNDRHAAHVAAFVALLAPVGASAGEEAVSLARSDGYVLHCAVHCHEEKLRTGVATISWVAPQGRAGAAALSAGGAEAPKIDVTVFADGFTQGRYVTFDRFGEDTRPTPATPPTGLGGDRRDLRAFDLRVDSTSTGSSATSTMPSGFAAPNDSETVSVEIENIEPGVLYSVRLRPPASDEELIVVCEAPVCPADIRSEGAP